MQRMALEAGRTCRGGTEACQAFAMAQIRLQTRWKPSIHIEMLQNGPTDQSNLQKQLINDKVKFKNHAGTCHTCTGQQHKVMYRRARRAAWQCNRLENDCKHVSVAIVWNHLPEAQNHDPGRLGSQIDMLDMCAYVLSINDSKIPADMVPEIVRNPQSDWETPMLTYPK